MLDTHTHTHKSHTDTQTQHRLTHAQVNKESLDKLSDYCAEFLVHGVDVEGKVHFVWTLFLEKKNW